MSAGLPGLGLGGLFVMICGFATSVVPGSRHRDWKRLFVLTFVLTVVGVLTWTSFTAAADLLQGRSSGRFAGSLFGAPVLLVSLAILAGLLVVPELLLWTVGTRATPTLPPVRYLGKHPSQRFPGRSR